MKTEKNAYESFVELGRLLGRLRPFNIDSSREMDFYQFGNFTIVKDDNFVCDECDGRKINFYVLKNGKTLMKLKLKKQLKN